LVLTRMNQTEWILEGYALTYYVYSRAAAEHWADMRRQWVGHQAEVSKKEPREPVIRFLVLFYLPES
jgi:hypothetical protein